jgi:adhesin transport system outer membrane protein
MHKKIFVLSLLTSVAILPFHNSLAETLQESVEQALSANPSVEAAQISKNIAQEDRKEARSGLFPEISTNLSAGRVYADTSTTRGLTVSRGAAYSWYGEGSASITQPIFDGMESVSRMDAAKERILSADYNITDVRENLALQAVQAHLSIMQAQATLDKTRSYIQVIESYLDRIQMMVDEGVADQSEVAQAENINLMLQSALADYRGQLEAALASYKQIVGTLPKSDLMKPSKTSVKILENVEDAIQFAKNNHPLIKAGENELRAAAFDVKAEKAGYYPDLDGEMSYLQKDQKEDIGGEVIDGRALVRMTWDFELGGAQKARTNRSKEVYSEILAQNRETIRTIEGDIRRAYAEYETAKNQMELVQKREVVTSELLDAYETQFEGARVRLLQLMQAENQLFNAQLESITAEYRYLLSQYSVLASMGQLLSNISSVTSEPAEIKISKEEKVYEEPEEGVSMDEPQEVSKAMEERIFITK